MIGLPIERTDEDLSFVLQGENAVSNAWKVIRKAQLAGALQQSMALLQREAAQNGLTPDLLDELLKVN